MNFAPSSSSYSIHQYPPPISSDPHPNPAAADEELEHMFDKVVTPSDVGKLNRLVIPKQHAERFFPLDPATGDKGLLLTFQDSGGVSWRFRYSYWTSSQSYVITKGWSRFVKDKHLLAGDLVSFHRANGRFHIDWRRRPPDGYNHHHHHPFPFFHRPELAARFSPPPVVWLRRGTALPVEQPLVFESVPVVHGKAAAKRLRLFGVNMDYPNDDNHEELGALLSSPLTLSQHHRHHVVDRQLSSTSHGVALELRLNDTASATRARRLRFS